MGRYGYWARIYEDPELYSRRYNSDYYDRHYRGYCDGDEDYDEDDEA